MVGNTMDTPKDEKKSKSPTSGDDVSRVSDILITSLEQIIAD